MFFDLTQNGGTIKWFD